MINDLPTIFEVVTGTAKKQVKEKSSVSNHSSNKSKSNSKVGKDFYFPNPIVKIKSPGRVILVFSWHHLGWCCYAGTYLTKIIKRPLCGKQL